MRWPTFFCILLCISLIQSTLINWINVGSAIPDLYFPVVIFYAFLMDVKTNAITNWFTGLTKDLFSDGNLGINSVFFIAMGFLVWTIRGILFRNHLVTQILVTFIFSLLYNLLYALHTYIIYHSMDFTRGLRIILFCSLYTAAIAPVMFYLFSKLQPTQNFLLKE